jgi:hypothetical protein
VGSRAILDAVVVVVAVMMMMMMMMINPWSRALLEKLTVTQLVKKFPPFMEPKGSLPCSQGPATGQYP